MDHRLLAQVAQWYYVDGATQAEIAARIRRSRASISRLLTLARETGVVEIHIRQPVGQDHARARWLEQEFGLKRAVVVATAPDDLATVARYAAREVERAVQEHSTLAVSYGTSVYETVRSIIPQNMSTIEVVQLAALDGVTNPLVDGWELARLLATQIDASYYYLYGPLIAHSQDLYEALLADPAISLCLNKAESADVALVGLGSMHSGDSSLVRAGHLTAEQLQTCRAAGSVGYICGRHYDENGRPLGELNSTTLSLPLQRFKLIPYKIAVAIGETKTSAIRGAIRGGYMDCLITDSATAVLLEGEKRIRRTSVTGQRQAGTDLV